MNICVRVGTHLSLVVDVVEIFPDTGLWALALGVGVGGSVSGGSMAGAQAVSSGHSSAADSRGTEEQHVITQDCLHLS